MTRRILRGFWVLSSSWPCSAVTGAEQAEPIRLHPENSHYFLWRGKPTFRITGFTFRGKGDDASHASTNPSD